ncbi:MULTISPECIES: amino acid ABC transporter substrate-binding protein [Agrobacterium]|uniref:Amino acid ABC transporter substrate-binding protein n=1 Tax=Agrobacterium rosae TaxID=1972867 RepID=A0A1R3TKF6_9HYPH|nr:MULTISPECIES: amino acid ABC transporter substrate-binding protein [Agrobacterium]MDX8302361.1 amino acid ABC transporter substrate-binding protein [Agrobacterium rosae]SCX10168.1 Glutamate/aspartate periplasmic-binding protein precursor [Agrobacterium rosae]SCX15497.1 Glutamate/aspartate periplasmic-binding protein precursor [Agrobacterium sp. DSM 25558]
MRRALSDFLVLPAALFMLSATFAFADFNTPTLERIRETGKIRIGYGVTAPFSFTAPNGEVVGYSIDLCRQVAEKLKTRLKLEAIDIEFVPRTPSNRIQLLNDGTIDIECNASTNTVERRKSANFAISHFYSATRYVSLAKNHLETVADLKGRSVSVALGTVNVSDINEINRAQKLNISVVPMDSLQAAFDLVTDGRVSAFAMDEVLLSTMIAQSKNPADYQVSTEKVTGSQPFGFMMRLNDTEFTAAVNDALAEIYKSPDMAELYKRWFESPIPGKGITLNVPMSEALKATLANPAPIQ